MSIQALLFLALVAPAMAGGAGGKISPIEKVVQMMNDMMAKSKAEKNDEQIRFAEYKTFCEMTSKEKTESIAEGKATVDQLKAKIGQAGADAARLADEAGVINGNLASWQGELKELEAERAKTRKDFEATHKDYVESIDSVEMAKKKLAAPKSFAQVSDSLVQLSSKVLVPAKAKKIIASFLQLDDPMQSLLQDEVDFKAPEAAVFESSSGGVIDMVEKLGDKFEKELEEAEKRETNAQHNFNMMKKDLDNSIEDGTEEVSDKMASKASAEQDKSSAEGDLADTSASLAADMQYLADLTAECEQKSTDYAKRQEVRQGEIEAIQKAIEIMTSDDVAGGLKHVGLVQKPAGAALAQLRSTRSSSSTSAAATAQNLVAKFLGDRAAATDSKVLALLAEKASDEPFKKVIKMIKDMITKLMEEANEEAEHKAFCDAEMGTNKATRDAKTDEAAKLKATIDELTADIGKCAEEVSDLEKAIQEVDAAIAKATGEREEEKAKNQATIDDSKVAQEATAQALAVLKEFYEKAANPTSLPDVKGPIKYDPRAIQILSKTGGALVQVPGAPEMESGAYTGNESGGIVGMLEVIESDFARVVSETSSSEADAQRGFEQFMTDSAKDKAVKQTDVKFITEKSVEKQGELNEAKKDLKSTNEELGAALAYFEKLKPSCIDAGVSYEERVAQRKAEIESLQEALKILSE